MTRLLILTILSLIIFQGYTQSKEYIDSLNKKVILNMDNYNCCLHTEIVEEGEIDSIWFYSDRNDNLIYIHSMRYLGSIHNAEDFAFTDLLLDKEKVIFMRSWGYLNEYKNSEKVVVKISENIRSYYKYSGESILCHEMREAEGPYALRDSLLNSVPLKPKSGWLDCTDRVDRMIEDDYLTIFRNCCQNKNK